MAVSRVENQSLVKKAGKILVDLAFNLTSNRPISNSACSEGMLLRNVCEYQGKLYKLNLDGTRGDEIEMSAIKSIQRGTDSPNANNTDKTVNINTVNPDKTEVILNCISTTNDSDNDAILVSLTSNTFTYRTGALAQRVVPIISYQIIEYV